MKNMTFDFDIAHDIAASKHFYQFYKNTDDYISLMMAYFRAGLEKGQACAWLVTEKIGLEEVHRLAELKIPRFLYYLCAGQIQILSAEDWYLTNGTFDEEHALANAQRYVENFMKQGYHCVRLGGSCAAAAARHDWWKFESYEQKVHEIIKGLPIIALCAYPILECSLRETKVVVDSHDDVLINHL